MTQPGATDTTPRPTPLAVALGLVVTGARGARRLPFRAVQLPVVALNGALVLRENARREYDELAERGEAVLARLRGRAAEVGDDLGEGVRTGRVVAGAAVDGVRTGVGDVVDKAQDLAGAAGDLVDDAASRAGEVAGGVAEALPGTGQDAPSGATTEPKGEPTPSRDDTPLQRPDTAATAEVVAAVEEAVDEVAPRGDVAHDDLPLPDYDHMTLGSLRGRLRSLTVEQLVTTREYEKAHADRLPVVTMLDNRIAKLRADGAEPTGTPGSGTADLPPAAAPVKSKGVGARGAGPGDQVNVRLGDANKAQTVQRDPRR